MEPLLLVFAAYVVVIASPGPSTMAIMGVAMSQGRRAAVALALGVVTGSMIWALLAATGLSTLLTAYAEAIVAIKIAGGLYLLYLAWKSARAALSDTPRHPSPGTAMRAGPLWRQGVLLHLTNPKAILGWVAIMSLGVGPQATANTLALIVAGCAVLGITVNLGYALAFSTGVMTRAYAHARRWIEGALAVLFGLAGIRLLLSRT